MNVLTEKLERSAALPRVIPFLVFIVLTYFQGKFGEASRYWFYLAKTLAGAWLLWTVRPLVKEMKWAASFSAVIAGVAVFLLWVGLDGLYPSLERLLQVGVNPILRQLGLTSWLVTDPPAKPAWNPYAQFGGGTLLAWFFVVVRTVGSSVVVPPLEEVFYRSFLYRYLVKPDFLAVPLGLFAWLPFLLTSIIFGATHFEWLAGILCGFIYQGLVCWNKRLGDAMLAHAITNFLLSLWIVWRGAWHFW